jgi:hypothetical protein
MQKQENNQYFYRLEKVSIYHSLSALGVTQSVYAKIASECTRGQMLNFQVEQKAVGRQRNLGLVRHEK